MKKFEKQYLFIDFLKKCCKDYNQMNAIQYNDKIYSYNQIYEDVMKLADYLYSPGNYCLINCKNKYNYIMSLLASVISCNVALLHDVEDEIEEPFRQLLYTELTDEIINEVLKNDAQISGNKYSKKKDEVALILCSSGTTGIKKGIMLSQKNVLSTTVSSLNHIQFQKGAMYVNILPFYHSFGIVADLLAVLYSGGCVTLLDHKYSFYQSLPIYHPDHLNLTPLLIEGLLKLLKTRANKEEVTGGRLKTILCAGASLSPQVIKEMGKYGIDVYMAYGLTEASPCVSIAEKENYRIGSCGLINDCNEVIISPESEILVKGDNVMIGYLDDEELTRQKIIDNYLHTGDIGKVIDNYLYVLGRKDNMIILPNGQKIVPEYYEAQLEQLDEINEVLLKYEDQVLKLIVSACSNKTELIKEKILSMNLFQSYVDIIFTNDLLPKNKLGKKIRGEISNGK